MEVDTEITLKEQESEITSDAVEKKDTEDFTTNEDTHINQDIEDKSSLSLVEQECTNNTNTSDNDNAICEESQMSSETTIEHVPEQLAEKTPSQEILDSSDNIWTHQWNLPCLSPASAETETESENTCSSSLVSHQVPDNNVIDCGSAVTHTVEDTSVGGGSIVAHMVTSLTDLEESVKDIVTDIVDNVTETASLEEEEVSEEEMEVQQEDSKEERHDESTDEGIAASDEEQDISDAKEVKKQEDTTTIQETIEN